MNDELKPCPFCGGEAKIKRYDSFLVYIKCGNSECFVSSETVFCRSIERAIHIWNTRPNE